MIKRANQKKRKGFSLIELIIVLAVMAIIALIAIPNFTAVRENSKAKADLRSCETIERTILMLVSDESISGNGLITYTGTATPVVDKTISAKGDTAANNDKAIALVKEALAETKSPQGKTTNSVKADGTFESKTEGKAVKYAIVIKDGAVTVKPSL
ncbi:MAG: type II secretion system protein [Clostridium sp.]|nr:type II secretion system protein [Clostridium sp.]MDU7084051.1 type II secretion system protein [Clostridium sp.]